MPRKPNYNFERMERDRLKAAKKEQRKAEKDQRKADASGEAPPEDRGED